MKAIVIDLVPGLIGAVIGGILGYFAFDWAYHQNLKAGVVPGALIGLGSGLLSSRRSVVRGVICGIGALALSLFTEWKYFGDEESIGSFLSQIHKVKPLSLLMIAVGGFLGFRWGGESFKPRPGKPNVSTSAE